MALKCFSFSHIYIHMTRHTLTHSHRAEFTCGKYNVLLGMKKNGKMKMMMKKLDSK